MPQPERMVQDSPIRAHRFFAAAGWCLRQFGLLLGGLPLAELIVTSLLLPGAPTMLSG